MKTQKYILTSFLVTAINLTCAISLAHEDVWTDEIAEHEAMHSEEVLDDYELLPDFFAERGCTKASSTQLATVNSGNRKYSDFIETCVDQTGSTKWCEQIARPNPASKNTFFCTYSPNQPHRLIHPTTATWKNAIKAIELIQRLSTQGICVSQIYNWWRPEPYNKNVGGSAGRHPFGTSVDVRFCTNSDAIKAFDKLCEYRKKGELRAIGYYGSTGLHFGIGDSTANTWGRNCK